MNKEDLYIEPEDFKRLFQEWNGKGKPTGNDKTYAAVWDTVKNAVKANVGKMQRLYGCTITHYDDKVLDSSCKVVTKLLSLKEPPNNIVNLSWLYTFGVVFGPKARQQDFEDMAESTDNESEGGDEYTDMLADGNDYSDYYSDNNY